MKDYKNTKFNATHYIMKSFCKVFLDFLLFIWFLSICFIILTLSGPSEVYPDFVNNHYYR